MKTTVNSIDRREFPGSQKNKRSVSLLKKYFPVGHKKRISPLRLICSGLLFIFLLLIVALIVSDIAYLAAKKVNINQMLSMLSSPRILFAIRMSVATSVTTLLLIMVTAVPIGYAMSRFQFFGRSLANTIIDTPIVLPPVVTGISLLAFFSFGIGAPIKQALETLNLSLTSGFGIVLCQYLVAVSYCIRSVKSAFDNVDQRLENVAQVLGCSEWQAFWRVSVPLARNGLIAGGIMAWARSIGVFGPLMVFVGTGPKVLVMPTTLWLELSIGNIETSVFIALVMLAMAGTALTLVHWLSPKGSVI